MTTSYSGSAGTRVKQSVEQCVETIGDSLRYTCGIECYTQFVSGEGFTTF